MESLFTFLKMPLAWVMPFLSPVLKALPGSEYFFEGIGNHYAKFDGRARRSEFWYFVLGSLVYYLIGWVAITIVVSVLSAIKLGALASLIGGILYLLLYLPLLVPSIAVAIRRLQDTGKSGWLILLSLIPFGGIVLLIFYVQDSTPGSNQYGPNPKGL